MGAAYNIIFSKCWDSMITLNLNETLLFNIGINLFSAIISYIILQRYNKVFTDTYDIWLLRTIQVLFLFVLLTDTGMWIMDGRPGNLMRTLIYVDIILYFILQLFVAMVWLRYAYYRIIGLKIPKKYELLFIILPFALFSVIVVSAPLNSWCFYLDDLNRYHRGILSAPMSFITLAYLISVSILALARYRKEPFYDRKKELLTIAFFVVLPFVGGLIQTMFYGISVIWPSAVISSLLILLNKESQLIAQDSLTRLNNRRNMERYLITYEDGENRPITIIMLDINCFKSINDKYGHSSGDIALIQAADLLRTIFNQSSVFLARYAGDEFVVILPQSDENIAIQAIQKIKDAFDALNKTALFPFQLSVSAGYAISSTESAGRIAQMLKDADAGMYRDKMQYHTQIDV